MRVAILTSALRGTASHHLPHLIGSTHFQVVQVILAEGAPRSNRLWKKKLKKILRIGPLGALVGYRMRSWYGTDVQAIAPFEDLDVLCQRLGIPFVRIPSVNHADTIAAMRAAQADVAISLGNGYIGSKVFSAPRLGMLNIHHELLPAYQNAQGVIWQLYNNSTVTGYTIHRIDKGIDTGAIVHQEEVPIVFQPTLRATVAHTMLAVLDASAAGLRLVLDELPAYLAAARPQGNGRTWTTPSFLQFQRIHRNYRRLRQRTTA
ncbi:MAG TPA: formyltransferase family protein [Flavobacteriales bacterium]|nr:formyltransferase family protein [Flavobacteriales bacterium]